MKNLPVILALLIAMTCTAQRTTRRGLHAIKPDTETACPAVSYDTVAAPSTDIIEVKGYDKPLRSRRETFFATNTGSDTIRRIAFTISYYDLDKKLLHRASHNVRADIPSGESRLVGVRSWDVQQSFYYHGSTVSHRSNKATPYDVTITVDTVFTATRR